jgi:hypothetical protein
VSVNALRAPFVKISRRGKPLLIVAVLACGLSSCATGPIRASSDPRPGQATSASRTHPVEPPEGEASQRPKLVPDDQAPVAPDLRRLAERFVSYAVGDSDTFPHGESVSMALGGQPVLSIDDIVATLSRRAIWRICPAGWEGYGAASCPVDLLGPITDAVENDVLLVYSAEYGDVTCAPTRSGPLPHGRLVVLRPSREWRTCASDFALVLAADDEGRLRAIDLTLSDP